MKWCSRVQCSRLTEPLWLKNLLYLKRPKYYDKKNLPKNSMKKRHFTPNHIRFQWKLIFGEFVAWQFLFILIFQKCWKKMAFIGIFSNLTQLDTLRHYAITLTILELRLDTEIYGTIYCKKIKCICYVFFLSIWTRKESLRVQTISTYTYDIW